MTAWMMLIIAGFFEIAWAIGLKLCGGFRPSLLLGGVITCMTLSVVFLSYALRVLPLSIAYSVWTGIGVAGVAVFGVFFFSEQLSLLQLIFLLCVVVGIVGLKYTT